MSSSVLMGATTAAMSGEYCEKSLKSSIEGSMVVGCMRLHVDFIYLDWAEHSCGRVAKPR